MAGDVTRSGQAALRCALISAAVVVAVAVGGYVGIYVGLLPVGTLDARAIQSELRQDLSRRLDTTVRVTCPDRIWQQKGRIVDCKVTRNNTGASSIVRVVQEDHRGHYRAEVSDPLALAEEPTAPPMEPYTPPLDPAEPAPLASGYGEPQGECTRAPDDLLAQIAANPRGDAGPLALPSGYQLPGEQGYVVGGFLSSADGSSTIDGAFGTWFVRYSDRAIFAYTDAALGLTNWPQIGDGDDTDRTTRVRACAEANAG